MKKTVKKNLEKNPAQERPHLPQQPQQPQQPNFTWVLGPGECLGPGFPPYPYYRCQPPYCTPSKYPDWCAISFLSVDKEKISVDHQVTAVNRWIEQLVRKELGGALIEAEKNAKRRFVNSASVEAAALINRALELKAGAKYGK